jgi:hypothetical protein
MVEVRDPPPHSGDLMIGAHDAGAMNNGIDIHQPRFHERFAHDVRRGVCVRDVPEGATAQRTAVHQPGEDDVVVMPHVQGNLRFVNCARATVLANCSYEGSVVVEGKDPARDGLLGLSDAAGDHRHARPVSARQPQHRDERLLRGAGRQRLPVRRRGG